MMRSVTLHSGRTTLLFQYAYSSATEGRRVLFITSQRKSYAHPPMFPKGFQPNPDVLHLIRMKYCENHSMLLNYLAHFHLMEQAQLPEVIVVDGCFPCTYSQLLMPVLDFSDFFSSLGNDKCDAIAHALALLRDSADFVSSVLCVIYCFGQQLRWIHLLVQCARWKRAMQPSCRRCRQRNPQDRCTSSGPLAAAAPADITCVYTLAQPTDQSLVENKLYVLHCANVHKQPDPFQARASYELCVNASLRYR